MSTYARYASSTRRAWICLRIVRASAGVLCHGEALCWAEKEMGGVGGWNKKNRKVESVARLSVAPCRPTALLVRLTFKGSWDADNNPTTSCCEKTFRMVTEFFDTALVILAGVTLRKHHTHTTHSSGHHHYILFEHRAFYIFQNFPLLSWYHPFTAKRLNAWLCMGLGLHLHTALVSILE